MIYRCRHCRQHVEWMSTKLGRLLFNHMPVPVSELGEREGWIPGTWTDKRGKPVTMLAPLSHYQPATQNKARFAVVPHRCPNKETADG